VNRDHIDRPGTQWNRSVAWGLFIPGLEPDPFIILAFLFLLPLPLSLALMEHGDSSRGSRASEEVDGPSTAQRCHTDDWAFAGSGCVLNTSGLSADDLFRIAVKARASPLESVAKEAEEQALAGRRGHERRGEGELPHQAA
jgi:hypothetical protein